MNISEINLDDIPDSQIILSVLPEKIITEYQILVLCINSQKAVIAIAEYNYEIIREIGFRLGCELDIKLADKLKLSQKIARLLHQQAQINLASDSSIINYTEKLFADAVSKSASDIHLESYENYLKIRFRIDGVLYNSGNILDLQISARLISHLKVLAQLDITESRLPQDGRLRISLKNNNSIIDCRLSTCPTLYGEKIVLRLLNSQNNLLSIDQLGFSEAQKKIFLEHIYKPQGLIIVTGPTGSGKTVSLYTALNILNKPELNIVTAEDPIEIDLLGINQVAVNTKIDLSFSKILRAFLRQDPDIIMVGEMRDAETADIAIKAAQTGHLVLSTLHTNSAAETLTRLLNMGIPAYHIISAVVLIIAQRLIRIICVYCQGKFEENNCLHCQKGYKGRIGIFELLPITENMREILLASPTAVDLEKQAIKDGMMRLYDHGLEKVRQGITDMKELLSILG